jgi:hypothetical protein
MRADHREILFRVAEKHTCFIGVREPNPLAERWIGRAGCAPKSVRCKAKTADSPGFEFAGLVTSPELRPEAFTGGTLPLAQESWRKFAKNGQLPMGFTVATEGREKGLVRERGQLIHADYDLMALNRSDARGRFLETSQRQQEELFEKVHVDLNAAFGTLMIQHGAEFMWDGGVGARAREYVYWFGPGRTLVVNQSSMPTQGH